MSGGIDIGGIDRRARTAGYGDGLLEIFAAIVLLTIALAWLANPSFVGILAALIVIYGWKVVDRVKQKVTYPRIGYYRERAEEPKSTARGMLLFMGGAFLLMIAAIVATGSISDAADWRRAAPLLSGLSLAAGFWYAGDNSGLIRHRVISVWSVVSAVLLWLFGSGADYSGVVWHLLSLAAPLLLLGIWSLLQFLNTHPVQDDPADG